MPEISNVDIKIQTIKDLWELPFSISGPVFPALRGPRTGPVAVVVRDVCSVLGQWCTQAGIRWFKGGAPVDLSSPGQRRLCGAGWDDSRRDGCRVTSALGHGSGLAQTQQRKLEIGGGEPVGTIVSEVAQMVLWCRIRGQSPLVSCA